MTKCLSGLVFVLLFATIWSGCGFDPAVVSGPAPDFTLNSLNGDAITLSNLKDQIVVLDFWATWCRPCVDAMPELEQLHKQYTAQGVVVLAINVEESRADVAEFMAENGYTLTVLLDADGRITDAYGVKGIPHTVIVDREREMHYTLSVGDVENTLDQLLEE
ncbi:MAG: TlpA family protein disulfide reductase [Chloroflexi bacterium]|nr:TlpA family protein disulfide reductase [Chloroflexota bacterium]